MPNPAKKTAAARIRAAEAAAQAAEAARDAALLQLRSPAPGQAAYLTNQVINALATPVEGAWQELEQAEQAAAVWGWLKLTVALWLIRKAAKIAGWLLLVAVVIAAWPLTAVTAAGYAAAWCRGRPPAWLRRTAGWALIMLPAWLAATMLGGGGLQATALVPVRAWQHDWPYPQVVAAARTLVLFAPVTVPAGFILAAGLWAWRTYAIITGLGGITASAPITFDTRRWHRQVRAAKGLTAAPGAVPLLARGARIPVRGTIRAVGHRWDPVFTLPASACARHMVIVGSTGSGKTNLMIRLWAGWFTATLNAASAGRGNRPLLIVLDCKGGPDARRKAARTRRLLYGAGARQAAISPNEARLSLWDLPARDLAVLLYQMIQTGDGKRRLLRRHPPSRLDPCRHRPARPASQHRRVLGPARCPLADQRLVRRPPPAAAGPGPGRRPPPARRPAAHGRPAGPARIRAGRPRHPGRQRRMAHMAYTRPGKAHVYYQCPYHATNPRHVAACPDHPPHRQGPRGPAGPDHRPVLRPARVRPRPSRPAGRPAAC